MSCLILDLHPGDALIINGASLRFRNRAMVELTAHARFLVGKQIMPPAQATSPARRIYFALQTAYIGNAEERGRGLAQARELAAAFKAATTSALACRMLDRAIVLAEADQGYRALKLSRRIMLHEDKVLAAAERPPVPTGPARTDLH